MNIKKLTYSAFMVAIGVVCSPIHIPLGFAKCFPVQHLINVISAVMLGPVYALMTAFGISLIRNLLGMGTLLAFPGSMIGALLSAILYKRYKKLSLAFVGEIFGTGILGALAGYPVARLFMNKDVALFAYVIPFSVSTVFGAFIAFIILKSFEKSNILEKIKP